ncbi:flagellar motor protein MotB [Lentibacillus cibarius]|uniref:Flagellar motor protein MotB n=1 Tax=Lentibacillus cibarius TaxID=2583219 RepID=A0A549YEG0_9BACI|nr:flagellar motor protein MotB [Lentibacillus cibarius]TMN21396.1 flagellar motor protein MotB [Lentibacillus cibarius]TRM10275.1 flagellar motor protein MotB [Lentibacillus cibarius]
MKNKKQRNRPHVSESWLLPYSDLLTLLVALFIVLFAMSEIDAQKYERLVQVFNSELSGGNGVLENNSSTIDKEPTGPAAETGDSNRKDNEKDKGAAELTQLQNLQKQINDYISKNGLTDVIGTTLSGEGLLITILNDVSFDTGSAKVKAKGKAVAREVSNFLYTDPPHEIIVSGHTDNRPIHTSEFSSNWELSAMRAINFMRLLLKNEQLDPERFSSKGYGEHHPIAPNTNGKNMAKNRRVELLILPNYDIDLEEGDSTKNERG